jgi:hypothetical protein
VWMPRTLQGPGVEPVASKTHMALVPAGAEQ